jgi:hypothetical protein
MLRICVDAVPRQVLVCALALAALSFAGAARAADIYPGDDQSVGYGRYESYEPAPYARETYRPRIVRPPALVGELDGYCRIRHRRAVDEYGREVIRRVRICDEGVVAQRPAYDPRSRYGYGPPPRVWSPSPRPIDPGYDDEED